MKLNNEIFQLTLKRVIIFFNYPFQFISNLKIKFKRSLDLNFMKDICTNKIPRTVYIVN